MKKTVKKKKAKEQIENSQGVDFNRYIPKKKDSSGKNGTVFICEDALKPGEARRMSIEDFDKLKKESGYKPVYTIADRLSHIQRDLRMPKNKTNEEGGYNYRTAEDILTAVKKLLWDGEFVMLREDVVEVGKWPYIKAEAIFSKQGEYHVSRTMVRENDSALGTSLSQESGASISYARKYALCGLFAIGSDADPDETPEQEEETKITQEYPKDIDEALKSASREVGNSLAV